MYVYLCASSMFHTFIIINNSCDHGPIIGLLHTIVIVILAMTNYTCVLSIACHTIKYSVIITFMF